MTNKQKSTDKIELGKGDALLVIDIQNDFLSGGSLAVPEGDQAIPVLNGYIDQFSHRQLPVFATRDWHPANHSSFIQQGGPWPEHCIADSKGAEFANGCISLPPLILFQQGLRLNRMAILVLKTRHSSCNWIMQTPSVCSSAD